MIGGTPLVALHMVSGHDIPLVYMALYVLHEAEISRDGRGLRHELIADTDAQVMDAPDWRKNIAALHFGVPADDSLTILYGRDIESALISGDSTRLLKLMTDDACREVCYQRVQSLVEGWTRQPAPRELTQVARALPIEDKSPFIAGSRIMVRNAILYTAS